MWLLNTSDGTLHHFDPSMVPPYAILSHVWRGKEQSFQEVRALTSGIPMHGEFGLPRGLSPKIWGFCDFARTRGYGWVWVDTCCIDKSSSAELSEALNSMFTWYANAEMCYALLDDIHGDEDPRAENSFFRRSHWFTRGWTLQELLAPRTVVFVSPQWQSVGSNYALCDVVEDITGIDEAVLTRSVPIDRISVARRMSWASKRKTFRIEDRAYSLMGMFGVHMSTVYGEGAQAFVRLQEEILKQLPDQTIFVWGSIMEDIDHAETSSRIYEAPLSSHHYRSHIGREPVRSKQGLLARSPEDFALSGNIRPIPFNRLSDALGVDVPVPVYHPTSGGLRVQLPFIDDAQTRRAGLVVAESSVMLHFAVLACTDEHDRFVVLYLRRESEREDGFSVGFPTSRAYLRSAFWRSPQAGQRQSVELRDVYVMHRSPVAPFPPQIQVHALPSGFQAIPTFAEAVLTFFFVPSWVLARLSSAGFTPAAGTDPSFGTIQPFRQSDGIAVDFIRDRREDAPATKVASMLFYRAPLGVGLGSPGATWMQIRFGVGCSCVPKHSVQDVWVDVELGNTPVPRSRFPDGPTLDATHQEHHLSIGRSNLIFNRQPYIVRCQIGPWCGYPMRENTLPSCQYMVDITLEEAPFQGGSAQSTLAPLIQTPFYTPQLLAITPTQVGGHWSSAMGPGVGSVPITRMPYMHGLSSNVPIGPGFPAPTSFAAVLPPPAFVTPPFAASRPSILARELERPGQHAYIPSQPHEYWRPATSVGSPDIATFNPYSPSPSPVLPSSSLSSIPRVPDTPAPDLAVSAISHDSLNPLRYHHARFASPPFGIVPAPSGRQSPMVIPSPPLHYTVARTSSPSGSESRRTDTSTLGPDLGDDNPLQLHLGFPVPRSPSSSPSSFSSDSRSTIDVYPHPRQEHIFTTGDLHDRGRDRSEELTLVPNVETHSPSPPPSSMLVADSVAGVDYELMGAVHGAILAAPLVSDTQPETPEFRQLRSCLAGRRRHTL
ncbi:HET-domain-containing protein [Trametes coccinea BRFM310]|uniref:HET-domain-containing protein n=1 Tax=Trametes coccinea (strain BRFM310) TaxID=1353009 RepID=A0A1Y2IUD7_TRAC3|nr:HET-domain-containing protein [Trametes coccinea BRFM310]